MNPPITYNRTNGRFEAMIEGVLIASEESYLAADAVLAPARQAIIKAVSYLADLMTPPPPPAAPAAKPAKKSKKNCDCPSCIPMQMGKDMLIYVTASTDFSPADGVRYCAANKEYGVYLNGSFAQWFPKKEIRAAYDYLNHFRTDALRRAA